MGKDSNDDDDRVRAGSVDLLTLVRTESSLTFSFQPLLITIVIKRHVNNRFS